eukprot:375873-Alexandrium_andersonii.AAC.1
MSASLVGSEMCIRDRCAGAPQLAQPPQPGPRAGRGAGSGAGCGGGCPKGCLLYTSDAADDM